MSAPELEAFTLPTVAQQAATLCSVLRASARSYAATGQPDQAARYTEAAGHAARAALTLYDGPDKEPSA